MCHHLFSSKFIPYRYADLIQIIKAGDILPKDFPHPAQDLARIEGLQNIFICPCLQPFLLIGILTYRRQYDDVDILPVRVAADMKEGLWEITMSSKMEMPGISVALPPAKYTQCLTKNDFVPNKKEPGQECEKMSVNVSGNTVSWSTKCKSKEGTMKGTGKITYKGTAYEGVMNMTFPNQGGGEGKMTSNMNGKWMGNCK